MVKPTIGICCEFAQKHGAEFVQNFFEKMLDKFVRRVYNGIVPGKTGAKKTAGHGGKEVNNGYNKQDLQGCWTYSDGECTHRETCTRRH